MRNGKDENGKWVFTLDGEGIIKTGARDKLDRLLSHFYTTDGMQSGIYYRQFKPIQVIMAENVGNPEGIRDDMEQCLTLYLKEYFGDNVSVTVEIFDVLNDNQEVDNSSVGIGVNIEVLDKEGLVRIKKPVFYKDGVFRYTLDRFDKGI